jgi:hypothetical protein
MTSPLFPSDLLSPMASPAGTLIPPVFPLILSSLSLLLQSPTQSTSNFGAIDLLCTLLRVKMKKSPPPTALPAAAYQMYADVHSLLSMAAAAICGHISANPSLVVNPIAQTIAQTTLKAVVDLFTTSALFMAPEQSLPHIARLCMASMRGPMGGPAASSSPPNCRVDPPSAQPPPGPPIHAPLAALLLHSVCEVIPELSLQYTEAVRTATLATLHAAWTELSALAAAAHPLTAHPLTLDHVKLLDALVGTINIESATLPVQNEVTILTQLAVSPTVAPALLNILADASCPPDLLLACATYLHSLLSPTSHVPSSSQTFLPMFLEALQTKGAIRTAYATMLPAANTDATNVVRSLADLVLVIAQRYVITLTTPTLPQPYQAIAKSFFYDLVLHVQTCPLNNVRIAALDLWLDLNDLSDRDVVFKAPLYDSLLKVLTQTLAYPGPDSHDDVDEFLEYRRCTKDVLQECYRILRSQYLVHCHTLLTTAVSPDTAEVALFCITAVAGDVCQRARSKALTQSISDDKAATCKWVVDVTGLIVAGGSANRRVQVGMCRFLGTFSPVYGEVCGEGDVYSLLEYLINCVKTDVAKVSGDGDDSDDEGDEKEVTKIASSSVRSIFLNCTQKLTSPSFTPSTIDEISKIVSTVVPNTAPIESLLEICEGATRLCVHMSEEHRLGGLSRLCTPLLEYVTSGVQTTAALCIQQTRRGSTGIEGKGGSPTLKNEAGRMEATMQQLARGLKALGVVVKYLDGCSVGENGGECLLYFFFLLLLFLLYLCGSDAPLLPTGATTMWGYKS